MAMMTRNIFQEIIERKLPADIVFEDEHCLAFRDVNPQAPVHVLFIPKKAIRTHADLATGDSDLLGRLHWTAREWAAAQHLSDYRLVINCGEGAGQTVPHLHMHLLAGRPLGWPPG